MKEVELTGETVEDIFKKLELHIGKNLFEITKTGNKLVMYTLFSVELESPQKKIFLRYTVGN